MVPLVILLLCLGLAGAQFPGISDRSKSDLEDGLLGLLLRLRQDEFFDTLLIYGKDCVFHSLIKRLEVSTVLATNFSTNFNWSFGTLTMILCCDDEAELEENDYTFQKLQTSRRLVYIGEDVQPESVCEDYFDGESYNIAMVKEDFDKSKVVYSCRAFQEPNFEEVSLRKSEPIYIENFRNMHRKNMTAMADLMPPRSMVYKDKRTGEIKIMGYVANLITNFAQRVNATLNLYKIGSNSSVRELVTRVRVGQVDIGIALEIYLKTEQLETASYPFLMTPYCLMMQIPAVLPYTQVYEMIVDPLVLGIIFGLFCILSVLLIYSRKMSWQDFSLANVLLNDVSLRGLLGQSFPFPSNPSKHLRLIFIILCFASVMLTTMYDAYLQSYFTNPPSEPMVRSFEDFRKFKKKLAISRLELEELIWSNNSQFKKIHYDNIVIIENWKEYLEIRNNLTQGYNYLVTGDRWNAFVEQQKIFKEPVFYFSNDLCIAPLVYQAIPLRRYLPYRHLFEDHILRQTEFGLVGYWKGHSFFDMVRLGITPLEDLSGSEPWEESILMEDVSRILQLYLAAMLLSIICFVLEVFSSKKRFSRWRRGVGKGLKVSI